MPPVQRTAIVIGSGIIGCAIAHELSRSGFGVTVLERHSRPGQEQSGHNSQVIHGGYLVPPDTLKARLSVEGNRMLYALAREWRVPAKKTGALTVAFSSDEMGYLHHLIEQGQKNGASLRLLGREQVRSVLPWLDAIAALHAPEAGIFDVDAMTRAFMEHAQSNGARFDFDRTVSRIEHSSSSSSFTLQTSAGVYTADLLINCAGLHADEIAGMLGLRYAIHPVRGEYAWIEGSLAARVRLPIYPAIHDLRYPGKGIHLTPTVDGRVMLGPTATHDGRKDDYSTDGMDMEAIFEGARRFFPSLERSQLQPAFVGIRAKLSLPGETEKDFIIREESDQGIPGLISLIGMESPGLTAAPAIARYVTKLAEAAFSRG